jgi:K+-transporting ATPase ATPase B chain
MSVAGHRIDRGRALFESLRRLSPLAHLRNPVMAITWLGAAFTTLLWLAALAGNGSETPAFVG